MFSPVTGGEDGSRWPAQLHIVVRSSEEGRPRHIQRVCEREGGGWGAGKKRMKNMRKNNIFTSTQTKDS